MSIVWHPTRDLCYCVFGGNSCYGIEVFNLAGTRLTTVAPIGFDSRGAWWNPSTSQLEAGTHNNLSVIAKPLDAAGYPVVTTVTTIFSPATTCRSKTWALSNRSLMKWSITTMAASGGQAGPLMLPWPPRS